MTIPGKRGEPAPASLNYPGEDLLRSLLLVLRPFYLADEQSCFKRVRNMLARHAKMKGGDLAEEVLVELKAYKKGERAVFSESPFVIQTESSDEEGSTRTGTLTVRDIFEDYLNGIYFHRDEDRRQRTEA